MSVDDVTRLRHMLEAAGEALAFIAGRTRADLDRDRMLALALVKCLEIIGEAAHSVSAQTREQVADIPWPDNVGMRHRLIHAYYDVNLNIVWKTVTEALPPLIVALRRHVPPS